MKKNKTKRLKKYIKQLIKHRENSVERTNVIVDILLLLDEMPKKKIVKPTTATTFEGIIRNKQETTNNKI